MPVARDQQSEIYRMRRELNRREFLRTIGLAAAGVAASGCASVLRASASESRNRPPNFVVIFIDDMGYADIGPLRRQGLSRRRTSTAWPPRACASPTSTPRRRLCSPSRAALMTGCYPQRVGMPDVLGPEAKIGISDNEMTIAEVLKPQGYATACFGKWHLGHHPQFLPTRHGFDEYFGLPYSNDMWPQHPDEPRKSYPDLPLIEGEQIVADVRPTRRS